MNRHTKQYKKLPFNPSLKQKAGDLRKAGNLSEILLWIQLKNRQLNGLDFDRQKIIGDYIVDFFCPQTNTVIEIDGYSHDMKVEYDAKREKFLNGLGLKIIHISDVDIKKNLDDVIRMLKDSPELKRDYLAE
ncbi:MAG: DUF559 domain-containing protein [Endomicrobium sp.]|jgi:very-short-patch-repair endonuclease|nr:DUF559 domain-containing protein [Endomicrobium sp.]